MSLVTIDWNPKARKVREFGALLILFMALWGGYFYWKGRSPVPILGVGIPLGLLALALPGTAGLWVYKAWMCGAFVMGTVFSTAVLACLYFGILTPLGLWMRWRGRDALRLRASPGDSHWTPVEAPEEPSYYERLY